MSSAHIEALVAATFPAIIPAKCIACARNYDRITTFVCVMVDRPLHREHQWGIDTSLPLCCACCDCPGMGDV